MSYLIRTCVKANGQMPLDKEESVKYRQNHGKNESPIIHHMKALARLSLALGVLAGIVAIFWFILPWWQVAAGMADGFMPFVVCTVFGLIFSLIGAVLYFCYRKSRSGTIGQPVECILWSLVSISGLIVSMMALRIILAFVPFRLK
jgi:hypothetical protein